MTLDHSFLSDSRNFFVWSRVISLHSWYLTSLVNLAFYGLTLPFPFLISGSKLKLLLFVFILFGREAPFRISLVFRLCLKWFHYLIYIQHSVFCGFKPFRIGFGFSQSQNAFWIYVFAPSHSDCLGSWSKNLTPIAVCS